jgi:hypothetical protein
MNVNIPAPKIATLDSAFKHKMAIFLSNFINSVRPPPQVKLRRFYRQESNDTCSGSPNSTCATMFWFSLIEPIGNICLFPVNTVLLLIYIKRAVP